jgi:hypothetical protein
MLGQYTDPEPVGDLHEREEFELYGREYGGIFESGVACSIFDFGFGFGGGVDFNSSFDFEGPCLKPDCYRSTTRVVDRAQ